MYIADVGSVMTPAYLAILAKGYAVRSSGDYMIAPRGEDTFVADGPVQLLGLIAPIEVRGETWEATETRSATSWLGSSVRPARKARPDKLAR